MAAVGAGVLVVGIHVVTVQALASAASEHPLDSTWAFLVVPDALTAAVCFCAIARRGCGGWPASRARHTTADGLEHTLAVNHLAAFLLTNLPLERLEASAPARVVTVSSGAQVMGRIDFNELQGERNYQCQREYSQSELANVLFTYELARRLAGTGVTANVLHPGVVRTGFEAEDRGRLQGLLVPIARPFMRTPERGAATSAYLRPHQKSKV